MPTTPPPLATSGAVLHLRTQMHPELVRYVDQIVAALAAELGESPEAWKGAMTMGLTIGDTMRALLIRGPGQGGETLLPPTITLILGMLAHQPAARALKAAHEPPAPPAPAS
jgi:hypothetical protein